VLGEGAQELCCPWGSRTMTLLMTGGCVVGTRRALKFEILKSLLLLFERVGIIDIESLYIDCSRFVMCPLLVPVLKG
jgi:hypothetical protein